LFPEILDNVEEIMVKNVVKVTPEQKIIDAAKLMEQKKIGCVVVVKDNKVVGVITERDFVRLAASGLDFKKALVKDGMTKKPVTCLSTTKIMDAYLLLWKKKIRHLPVVDKKKSLVGVLSLQDIVMAGKLVL